MQHFIIGREMRSLIASKGRAVFGGCKARGRLGDVASFGWSGTGNKCPSCERFEARYAMAKKAEAQIAAEPGKWIEKAESLHAASSEWHPFVQVIHVSQGHKRRVRYADPGYIIQPGDKTVTIYPTGYAEEKVTARHGWRGKTLAELPPLTFLLSEKTA